MKHKKLAHQIMRVSNNQAIKAQLEMEYVTKISN